MTDSTPARELFMEAVCEAWGVPLGSSSSRNYLSNFEETDAGAALIARAEGANQPLIAAQVAPTTPDRPADVTALRDALADAIHQVDHEPHTTAAMLRSRTVRHTLPTACPDCTERAGRYLAAPALAAQPAAPETHTSHAGQCMTPGCQDHTPDERYAPDLAAQPAAVSVCVCGHDETDHGIETGCQRNAIDHWTEDKCMAFTRAPR